MMLNKGLFIAFGLCVLCLVGCAPKGYVVGLTADTSLGSSWQARGKGVIGGKVMAFVSDTNTKVVDVNLCDGRVFRIAQKNQTSGIYVDFNVPFKLAGRIVRLDSVRNGKLYVCDWGRYVDSSAVGAKLPYFWANELNGGQGVDVRSLIKGKYALLGFWDPWCKVCFDKIPEVQKLYETVKERSDAVVVGLVDVGSDRLPLVRERLERLWVRFPNYGTLRQEPEQPYSASWVLNLVDYPTLVVVDRSGRIAYRSDGRACSREKAIEFFEQLIK